MLGIIMSMSVLPHQVKKTQQGTNTTYKNTQQILDFLLKFGEQDWFQLLFMCAKYESSSVNRKKLLKFEISTCEHFL